MSMRCDSAVSILWSDPSVTGGAGRRRGEVGCRWGKDPNADSASLAQTIF